MEELEKRVKEAIRKNKEQIRLHEALKRNPRRIGYRRRMRW